MPEDLNVNEREYGELIATVKHLSGIVESLQQQYSQDTAKLHHRLDEMFRNSVTKQEHEKLSDRVERLHEYSTDTRAMVDKLGSTTSMTRSVGQWAANAGIILLGAISGALVTVLFM